MKNRLFRPAALEALNTPERLDQMLLSTAMRSWVALLGLCLVLVAALVWSVFGSLPTDVSGRGILIRDGGVSDIHALGEGVLTDMPRYQVGQRIVKNQVIGQIAQPVLEQGIAEQEALLSSLAVEERAAQAATGIEERRQAREQRRQLAQLGERIAGLEKQLAAGRNDEVLENRLLALRRQQGRVEERLATRLQAQGSVLAVLHARQEETLSSLRRLRLEHRLASSIVSPFDGTVVEMMAMQGDVVRKGQSVLSVEINHGALEAMLYLPPQSNAKLIKPGMRAQVSPSTSRKERFGYLVGSVTTVARFPSTEQGMRATFDNPVLIREMNLEGPPIAVSVALLKDPDTRSGYRWSSRSGADVELSSGTLVTGTVVIENKRPISLVVPMLRQSLGL